MKTLKDLIKPDQRSKGWPPNWLCKQLALIPFSNKVPQSIHEMMNLAEHLAYYGYFKYEFYDLAFFYQGLTFEAALRTKYNTKNKVRLSKLMKKANAENLFPHPFIARADNLKAIRNNHAHPKGITIIPLFLRTFHLTKYLINCIFDDDARKQYPPIFLMEIDEATRNSVLWEAFYRVLEYNLPLGQAYEVAGASLSYNKGKHICIKCKAEQVIKKRHDILIPCKNCGETIFLVDFIKMSQINK
jgi:hypothetical protein